MAVQKSKVSRARRGARRSHNALKNTTLSTDQVSGERHQRHVMTSDGFYKGKKVMERNLIKELHQQMHREKKLKKYLIEAIKLSIIVIIIGGLVWLIK